MGNETVEAAAAGDVETLRKLLAKRFGGGGVNKPDKRGWYPLTAAADAGHVEALELLIAHGADPDLPDRDPGTEWPALAHAARGGHLDAVRTLLAAEPTEPTLDVAVLQAADMSSEGEEYVEILAELLRAGGNPNATDEDGANPALYVAVEAGSMAAVRTLLDAGAMPDYGRAAEGPGDDLSDYMNGGWTVLLRAVLNQPLGMITLLMDRGANPNIASSAFRKTPLMQAAQWDRPDVIRLLVERGAHVNTISPAWGTALSVACSEANERSVQALLELGAEVELGWEPTMGGPRSAMAAARGKPAIQRLLVSVSP